MKQKLKNWLILFMYSVLQKLDQEIVIPTIEADRLWEIEKHKGVSNMAVSLYTSRGQFNNSSSYLHIDSRCISFDDNVRLKKEIDIRQSQKVK